MAVLAPVRTEPRDWNIEGHWDPGPHRYDAAVASPLADADLLVSEHPAAACADAALDLALLDRGPSAAAPEAARLVLRAEAIASHLLNSHSFTPRQVAAAEAGQSTTAQARAIAKEQRRLEEHLDASRRAVSLGAIALAYAPPRRMASGQLAAAAYRSTQTWRGGTEMWPRGADYVPPHPARIAEAMDDLVEFASRTDIDPIAQAAVACGQIRTLDPFPKGADRVGRAVLQGVLRFRGAHRALVPPVSAALLAAGGTHDAAWRALRGGDPDFIVGLVARAVSRASNEAARWLPEVLALPEAWAKQAKPRAKSAAATLLPHLVGQPVVTTETVMELTGASQSSAYGAIAKLAESGVLTRVSPTRRDTAWAAMDVYDATFALVERLADPRR